MYVIKTKDKNSGATYRAANYKKAVALVTRLLEHGTKTYGDKLDEIRITRGKVKS